MPAHALARPDISTHIDRQHRIHDCLQLLERIVDRHVQLGEQGSVLIDHRIHTLSRQLDALSTTLTVSSFRVYVCSHPKAAR